jgi:threonine dehydratase
VLHGDSFDQARTEARRLTLEHELHYINPFDDPSVIAGQGTLAFEVLENSTLPLISGPVTISWQWKYTSFVTVTT